MRYHINDYVNKNSSLSRHSEKWLKRPQYLHMFRKTKKEKKKCWKIKENKHNLNTSLKPPFGIHWTKTEKMAKNAHQTSKITWNVFEKNSNFSGYISENLR